jgi:16S rRNA (adenine1518-N6/adenine1519-N6)-dimethyltransferase
MTLPAVSEHRPRKRFGQNFLRDRGVVQRILAALDPQPGETIVEIGPGLGALTQPLLERLPLLHVVELDRDLAARLRAGHSPERLSVHEADALKFDFCSLAASGKKLRLIGNLPYNISTPLLFHLLDQRRCVHDMLFMLQKEVVERMAAVPGGRDYGRLSVMIQSQMQVEKLFDVRPGAFHPPPKVDSSVVRLVPHATPPVTIRDAEGFARLVKAAFAQRRKTLRNNLKGLLPAETIAVLGIEPERRAETLTLAEFATLANALPPVD